MYTMIWDWKEQSRIEYSMRVLTKDFGLCHATSHVTSLTHQLSPHYELQ